MAMSMRRALLSYRNLAVILRTTTSQTRHLSSLVGGSSASLLRRSATSDAGHYFLAMNYLLETRRGFAKGRKNIKEEVDSDEDNESTTESVNVGPSIKAAAISQMEAATDSLSRELAKLRTGRASAGMLDHIIVESGGVKTPLSRMAAVSVLDSKTLSVTPYDPDTLKELEKAIVSSPLGLNPKVDNERLIAPIPPLTKEHMQAVCKVVAKSSEDVKQSVRRARQKALDTLKKYTPKKKDKDKTGSAFSVDDAKRLEKEIDDLTKKYIKSAEDMCKSKEKEITSG
ncbi:uncharacterized protein LOC116026847 [Ipomoea triloba]|uniref:uncharacterized protein LOC116026847 n=1 Tax=Ipomoea triloba TaxID=35885 RepID=UPI00125D1D0F|nr:uncharacterized protein LOC116026847 [Ipomoea triloba]